MQIPVADIARISKKAEVANPVSFWIGCFVRGRTARVHIDLRVYHSGITAQNSLVLEKWGKEL